MVSYKRVPMVRDLEYLAAFLRSIRDGDSNNAEEEIRRVRLDFESDKDDAVGKGKKLDGERLRLKSLVAECERLSYEVGIIEKPSVRHTIYNADPDVAFLFEGNARDERFRVALLKRLLATYSSFATLIFQIRAAPKGEIYASRDRTGGVFQRSVERYNLNMTQWTFEASRDLATQLDVINWRMLDAQEVEQDPLLGKRGYVLYLASTVCRLSELQRPADSDSVGELVQQDTLKCREALNDVLARGNEAISQTAMERGYLLAEVEGDAVLIGHKAVDEERFEKVIWQEYLRMTGRVPREPVYYCQLRDRVCETLRIQDHVFDRIVGKMITQPSLFSTKVTPGEGSLPMQTTTSRKQIPPRLPPASYIVYLKMEKPKNA